MAIKVTARLNSRVFQAGALTQALKGVVSRTALEIEREAKLRVKSGPKTGRTYRRGSIKKAVGAKRAREFGQLGLRQSRTKPGSFVTGYFFHRASAPGESPADDTGFLANSIRATPAKVDSGGVRAQVIVGARYGRRLEEEMNRPYLKPSVEKVRPRFVADVDATIGGLI
ncbi:MAG: hypothetical protein H0T60_17525 [Acidobacteria bacterium]|nr:hypothetical protein [Acidobacteriota bacterium]